MSDETTKVTADNAVPGGTAALVELEKAMLVSGVKDQRTRGPEDVRLQPARGQGTTYRFLDVLGDVLVVSGISTISGPRYRGAIGMGGRRDTRHGRAKAGYGPSQW